MYKVTAIVKMLAVLAAVVWLAVPAPAGDAVAPKLHMVYFYNPSCRLCTDVNVAVGKVEEKYKRQMTFERFNIADPELGLDYMDSLFGMMDELGIPDDVSTLLTVVVGEFVVENGETRFVPLDIIMEGDDIAAHIDEFIKNFLFTYGKGGAAFGKYSHPASFFSDSALASTPPTPDAAPGVEQARRSASGRSAARAKAQLRFSIITGAALADSVNPCAFATIIILVAMMSSAKRTRKEIMAVCMAFTAAVFLTYLSISIFLYRVIKAVSEQGGWFLIVSDVIYYAAFSLCVFFGLLCLWDAIKIFRGKPPEEMVMQLPKALKKRINVAMAKGVRARWLMAGVFVAGVSVSFFEAACTGQVLIPTTILIAELTFWESLPLLLWYNFLFVVPLLIIFGLVLLGVSSQQLTDFFRKNVVWTKVALAIVFLAMGLLVFREMHWPPGFRG